MERRKVDTVKVGDEMSQELKQYLRQRGKLYLWERVLYQHINCARQDHNELQLAVPQGNRLQPVCGANNDVGHLSLNWMLDILKDWFYWSNLEDDATDHILTCEHCLRFKGRQDKEDLHPLLATHPLELVHMDFLTKENPHTGVNVNILVITNHCTWYAKAVITSNQTAKARVIAFWNNFITNNGFPKIN